MYVPEPSPEETYQILLGLRERYEAHHKLRYTDEALDAAAKYSHQYISDRCFPLCHTAAFLGCLNVTCSCASNLPYARARICVAVWLAAFQHMQRQPSISLPWSRLYVARDSSITQHGLLGQFLPQSAWHSMVCNRKIQVVCSLSRPLHSTTVTNG